MTDDKKLERIEELVETFYGLYMSNLDVCIEQQLGDAEIESARKLFKVISNFRKEFNKIMES